MVSVVLVVAFAVLVVALGGLVVVEVVVVDGVVFVAFLVAIIEDALFVEVETPTKFSFLSSVAVAIA